MSIRARFDKYHGNIVVDKNKQERIEAITIASYIHFITEAGEASLNDIELVTSDGIDFGRNQFRQDDDVRLSFKIDGIDAYQSFNPSKIKIDTSDETNDKYPKEYTISKQGDKYITNEPLSDLNTGPQNLKIISIYSGQYSEQPVTHDDTIDIEVLPDMPANEALDNELSTVKANAKNNSDEIKTINYSLDDGLNQIEASQVKASEPAVAKEEDVAIELPEQQTDEDEPDETYEEDKGIVESKTEDTAIKEDEVVTEEKITSDTDREDSQEALIA